VNDPDIIVAIDRDAGNLPKDPIARQGLRPKRLGLETRNGGFGSFGKGLTRKRGEGGNQNDTQYGPQACHDIAPHLSRVFWLLRVARDAIEGVQSVPVGL
jgi:hypothetical protein